MAHRTCIPRRGALLLQAKRMAAAVWRQLPPYTAGEVTCAGLLDENYIHAHARYLAQYGLAAAQGARAYEHNAEFSPVLANAMGFYGAGAGQRGDTIQRVRGEIAEVKHVMIENIDKVGCRMGEGQRGLKRCGGRAWTTDASVRWGLHG